MYNRAVRIHKLFYKALMRILLNQIREDVIVKEALQDFDELLDELCCSLDGYSSESVVNSNENDTVIKIFTVYKFKISTGNLQSFLDKLFNSGRTSSLFDLCTTCWGLAITYTMH